MSNNYRRFLGLQFGMFLLLAGTALAQVRDYKLVDPTQRNSAIDLNGDGVLLFRQSTPDAFFESYALSFPNGEVERLDVPGGIAVGIGASEQIAGNLFGDSGAFIQHADGTVEIVQVPGLLKYRVLDMNDRGDLVGFIGEFSDETSSFLWTSSTQEIHTFQADEGPLVLRAVTEAGLLGGSRNGYANEFVLSGEVRLDIPDCRAGEPNLVDVNDNGEAIVGCFALVPLNFYDTFLLTGDRFLEVRFPEASSTDVVAINNQGMIAGTAFFSDGRQHAFTAYVPEPMFSFGSASALFLFTMRYRRTNGHVKYEETK